MQALQRGGRSGGATAGRVQRPESACGRALHLHGRQARRAVRTLSSTACASLKPREGLGQSMKYHSYRCVAPVSLLCRQIITCRLHVRIKSSTPAPVTDVYVGCAQAQAVVPQHGVAAWAAQDARHPQPAGLAPSAQCPAGEALVMAGMGPCCRAIFIDSERYGSPLTKSDARRRRGCGCATCCCFRPRRRWGQPSGLLASSSRVTP